MKGGEVMMGDVLLFTTVFPSFTKLVVRSGVIMAFFFALITQTVHMFK